MKLFVTGAAGFIGTHFTRKALANGHSIMALSRNKLRSFSPSTHPGTLIQWIEEDIGDVNADHFREADAFIHFASTGVPPKPCSCRDMFETNVVKTLNCFKSAISANVKRFVIAGTCYEYGGAARSYDFIPTSAALLPTSCYGASKAAAFMALSSISKDEELEFFYGRIFSAYGDGQFAENLWPSLRKSAIKGEDFPMTSGNQIRDFIRVEDVALQFLDACTSPEIIPGKPLVKNIGSGKPQTVLQFVQNEWRRFNASGRILPGALSDIRSDNMPRIVAEV